MRRDDAVVPSPYSRLTQPLDPEAAVRPPPPVHTRTPRPPRPRPPRPASAGIQLKPSEIASAFDGLRAEYPPIMTPAELGRMLRYARATIYEWIAKGRLDGTFQKRGKHMRFWRDRVLTKFFNDPEWNDSHE